MMGEEPHVWTAVLAQLRGTHPSMCRRWFDDIEPLGLAGGTLRLLVREPVQLRYLQQRCQKEFTDAVQSVLKLLVAVRFVGEREAKPAVTNASSSSSHNRHGAGGSVRPRSHYSREAGECNMSHPLPYCRGTLGARRALRNPSSQISTAKRACSRSAQYSGSAQTAWLYRRLIRRTSSGVRLSYWRIRTTFAEPKTRPPTGLKNTTSPTRMRL